MKNVSNEFINLSKKVKKQDLKLTINDGELTVQEVHLMPVNIFNSIPISRLRARKQVIAKELKYSFEGQLFKTIMQQIEITVKNASEIKGKYVNFQYGIQINNEFEYLDIGEYYIKDVEDDKNKEELVVTGYDKMLNFMKPFKQSDLQLTYPCKIVQLVNRMGEVCGVELHSTDFFNSDLIVDEDFFTIQELTYRDVLEKIAQATLTTIFIKENKLYFCKIGDSVQTLDTSFLSNLVIEEKFGPVNALVLGRGSVEDNIESIDQQSINTNGRCEIRFDENELLDNKREEVIDPMLQQINGLKYYSFEASNLGVLWLEPCDVIIVKDREQNEYKTVYLKANVTINTGIKGDMEADIPETTTTEYKITTAEQKKTLKVERLAKKNEGLIQDLIQETSENSEKLSKHEQTIDGMKDTISNVETKVEDAQSTANTANTNAQNAQKTANENTTKITTTTTKLTEVEETVDGITQSVSAVEEKVETVENTANTAKSTADNINTNLSTNYYTKTETNSQIQSKADSITTSVTKEISTAKTDAINSANSSTDTKLKDYTVTSKLGTWVEQNWEYIKVAWNQISQYLKMEGLDGKATLNIYGENNNLLMSLSKDGQDFYDESGQRLGRIGLYDNKLAFAAEVDWNSTTLKSGMAWGVLDKNKNFLPIFYLNGFGADSDYQGQLALEGSMQMGMYPIYFEDVSIRSDPLGGFGIYNNETGETLAYFRSEYFQLSDIVSTYTNIYGEYNVKVNGNVEAENLASCEEISILSGGFYGNQDGYLLVHEKDGENYFYLEADTVSDKKVKKNIKSSEIKAIDRIKNIQHKQYEWKNDETHKNKIEVGYIAQELEKIDKNFVNVYERKTESGIEKNYTINRTHILATATKAIQEQQEIIEQLQEKDKQKDKIIADLIKRIENLEKGGTK